MDSQRQIELLDNIIKKAQAGKDQLLNKYKPSLIELKYANINGIDVDLFRIEQRTDPEKGVYYIARFTPLQQLPPIAFIGKVYVNFSSEICDWFFEKDLDKRREMEEFSLKNNGKVHPEMSLI